MPKTSGDFTPEQTRAIENADPSLSAGAIIGMAMSGELGVPSFHPSKATVNRIRAAALEAGRLGPEPEPTVGDRYRKAETQGFDFLEEMAEEIRQHKAEKGEHNAAKVKNYCQALAMIGRNTPKKEVRKPEPDNTPKPNTPRANDLLARLANGSSSGTEGDGAGRASQRARHVDAPHTHAQDVAALSD